ncbi:MAG: outer membrane beta-barrel protein [Cyclobacteriaceae bacterium]
MNSTKTLLTIVLIGIALTLWAQDSSNFKFSAYVDIYYSYDFSQSDGTKQYVTQAARRNEFNLNLGVITASYDNGRIRGNLGLQSGTYPSTNYAEPTSLAQMINQANVGIRLANNTWLDAGVMGGHFGYEGLFALDNELYTHALATEYTPYYQTGVQLSTLIAEKLAVRVVAVNGWQNIYETNKTKSIGLGVDYPLMESLTISYGNYYGNEGNHIIGDKFRFHNNAYLSYQSGPISSTAVFDYTLQESWRSDNKTGALFLTWINKYAISDQLYVAARYEFVDDPNLLYFDSPTVSFETHIITAAVSYSILKNTAIKAECRYFFGNRGIWEGEDAYFNTNTYINLGMMIRME